MGSGSSDGVIGVATVVIVVFGIVKKWTELGHKLENDNKFPTSFGLVFPQLQKTFFFLLFFIISNTKKKRGKQFPPDHQQDRILSEQGKMVEDAHCLQT